MKKLNKKGFTIVELVIVIAVIAILAGVMIPTFSGIVKKAEQNAALQEIVSAYKEELADDLTGNTNSTIEVKDKALIIQYDDKTDFYIKISDKGEASIVSTLSSETVTYKFNSNQNKFVSAS